MDITTRSGKTIAEQPKLVVKDTAKEVSPDSRAIIYDTKKKEILAYSENPSTIINKNTKHDKSPGKAQEAATEKGKEMEGMKVYTPILRPPPFPQRLKKKVED
ncbi:hypothetical protein HAX54_036844, partial [Datura stramonium]|nr:hypothetical protein [Datura stramonium]